MGSHFPMSPGRSARIRPSPAMPAAIRAARRASAARNEHPKVCQGAGLMKRRVFIQSAAASLAGVAFGAAAATRDWGAPAHYPDPDIVALDPRFRFNVQTGGIERL